jgi:nucleotide-binding universal stress UspA family protein
MQSGLPVLLAPPGQEDRQPRKILIGWKNTRETRRAVSDALPLLKIAEKVVVAHVCDDSETAAAEAELEDVGRRLERHGVETRLATYPRLGRDADEDLMALAYGHGADTVVAGAYGRSRMREWAFGGVTRNLLQRPEKRVLFSR